jgi:hypothetical protein
MTEKQQRTAANMREKMLSRYGDDFHHKHNKNHTFYRKHFKSHPIDLLNGQMKEQEEELNASKGLTRSWNLRKLRKRQDKGNFH